MQPKKYEITKLAVRRLPHTTGLEKFRWLVEMEPTKLVQTLEGDAQLVSLALAQSDDKRYLPSTYVESCDPGFEVGWFDGKRQMISRYSTAAEAVADYLLFSYGRGRLKKLAE